MRFIHLIKLITSLLKDINPKAIILSGGPASVIDADAPKPPSKIFELGTPILGICYGQQIMVEMLGGKVTLVMELLSLVNLLLK